MRNNDVNLTIGAESKQLDKTLRRDTRAVRLFSRKVGKITSGLNAKLAGFAKRTFVNPVAGLIGGAAVLAASKQIIDFDDTLSALKVQAGLSAEETMNLRKEIMDTSYEAYQSRGKLLSSFTGIIDKTGNMKFAREAMRGIGVAATATSSDLDDVSKVAQGLYNNMKITGDQMYDAFNILAAQGKNGSFIFKDMATQAERLTAAANVLGLSGLDDLKEFGAFLQSIGTPFGSPEELSTAVKNIAIRFKTEAKKIKKVAKFDVFDNKGNLKSLQELIKGVVKGTGGDIAKLNELFGESALAFVNLSDQFRSGNGFKILEQHIKNAGKDQLWADFTERSKTAKNQLVFLGNAATEFADAALAPMIANAAEALKKLTEDPAAMEQFRMEIVSTASAIRELAQVATIAVKPVAKIIKAYTSYQEMMSAKADQSARMQSMATKWSAMPTAARKKYMADADAAGKPLNIWQSVYDWENQMRKRTPFALNSIRSRAGGGGAPVVENKTEVTVNLDTSTGRVAADTKSSAGTARTKINLPRGSF